MKQKMKRITFLLMCVMAVAFANSQTIVTVDGLQYSLSGSYASVYRVASGNTAEQIIVPSTIIYDGLTYTVNAVLGGAFDSDYSNNKYVKSVTLPNTIKTIGSYAFRNSNITEVNLSEGITYIGYRAFENSKITEIVIPSTVTSFDYDSYNRAGTFFNCNLLRKIVYLRSTPPSYWTATSTTYVPDKSKYSNPYCEINNASVTEMITFSENTFTYTSNAPMPTWTNNVEGYTATFNMPTLSAEVGSHEEIIPVTFTKGEESFTAQIPYKYTIEPVKITAKVNDVSRTYGEENPTFTVSYTGFINGDNESVFTTQPQVSTTATASSNVGTYSINISGGVANNYTIEYEPGVLTVNKAPLTITVNDATKVYGSANPTFSLSYTGLKNGESAPVWTTQPQYTTTATTSSEVGTYPINVTCETKNYNATIVAGSLKVTKAALSIKANDASRLYCESDPEFTYTYSGFVNGDTEESLTNKPTIETDATMTSNAGTYVITPTGVVAGNYDISYVAGTLKINQRPLKVKAGSATREYGQNNPTFAVSYEGFVNNETEQVLTVLPEVSTYATPNSGAGTYDVYVSGGRAFNYTLSYENGTLTITPKALHVSVGNYERPYNENNPQFELIYDGLAGNDTENSLTNRPMVRTTATKTSDVGTYPLEVSGGYSPNYTMTYSNGTLTINKAEQVFTWDQELSSLMVNDQVELRASASSGLPVTYTMEENNYAELYPAGTKSYLECKAPGEFVITAIQSGNSNYYSTQKIVKNVKILSNDTSTPFLTIKQGEGGSVRLPVAKGSRQSVTIFQEAGWTIHSVTYNDEDVTYLLDTNNTFITPAIYENSTLYVVYEQSSSAINASYASFVKIQGYNSGVRVAGTKDGDMIRIYSLDGVLQKTVEANGAQTDIPLSRDKVYIVKVGTVTAKLKI